MNGGEGQVVDRDLIRKQSEPKAVCESACREMTVKEILRHRADAMRRRAEEYNRLADSLPDVMDPTAERALRQMVTDSTISGIRW